jgi:hypothetical protein
MGTESLLVQNNNLKSLNHNSHIVTFDITVV